MQWWYWGCLRGRSLKCPPILPRISWLDVWWMSCFWRQGRRCFLNRGQLGRVRLSCKPFNLGSTSWSKKNASSSARVGQIFVLCSFCKEVFGINYCPLPFLQLSWSWWSSLHITNSPLLPQRPPIVSVYPPGKGTGWKQGCWVSCAIQGYPINPPCCVSLLSRTETLTNGLYRIGSSAGCVGDGLQM